MPALNPIKPYWTSVKGDAVVYQGDVLAQLKKLPGSSVHCCVTSPPYWGLRDYGTARWEGGVSGHDHKVLPGPVSEKYALCACGAQRIDQQLGLESTPEAYVAKMVEVFREVRRVLRDDGTCWVNLGDSYAGPKGNNRGEVAGGGKERGEKIGFGRLGDTPVPPGLKPKDLVGIPWRVAFALQADGWYLRQDIIWAKPNPMPESVTDRCTKAHEYLFLLAKSKRYWFDSEAMKEEALTVGKIGGFTGFQAEAANVKPTGNQIPERGKAYVRKDHRNRRSVWTISTKPYSGAHFATMPPDLAELCIKAGSPKRVCGICKTGWVRDEIDDKVFRPNCECRGTLVKIEKTVTVFDPETDDGSLDRTVGNRNGKGASTLRQSPQKVPRLIKKVFETYESELSLDAHPVVRPVVFDPFLGSGTTVVVANSLGLTGMGIELSERYIKECAIPRIGAALIERDGPSAYLTRPDCMKITIGRKSS